MGAKKLNIVDVEKDVHELAMRQVEVLPELFQTRVVIDPAVVATFAEQIRRGFARAFPPVLVARTPEGRLILADGFHRHEAHRKRKRGSIRAIVRDVEEARGALLLGIEANLDPATHRKPEDDDRKHAAEMMIQDEEFRIWSDTEIGRRCGLVTATVRRIRLNLRQSAGIALPERVKKFRKDGTWTGKWQRYKNCLTENSTQGPRISVSKIDPQGRPYYRIRVGGKDKQLGTDIDKAQVKAEEFLKGRDENLTFLSRNALLVNWLMRRNVRAEHSDGRGSSLGEITVPGGVLVPALDPDTDCLWRILGRLFLSQKSGDQPRRLIVIGRFDFVDGRTRFMMKCAQRSPHPVEFLTPDQVVAEFGPKPDDTLQDPEAP